MYNYFFFCTNHPHWVASTKKIKELGIAKPSLWIGDDKVLADAQTVFSKEIAFSHLQLHYRTATATKVGIVLKQEYLQYFQSSQAIDDYCIAEKMMDLDDPYWLMSRLGRDMQFKMIAKFALQ